MKTKNYITVIILVAYVALIYFSPASYLNKPKFLFLYIAKFPLYVTNKIFYNLSNLIQPKDLIRENIFLQQTVDVLTRQLSEYKEAEAENARLKRLLEFKGRPDFKLRIARVISKDSSNLFGSVLIDRGEKSGIKNNTVVISEAGLIGRVESTSLAMSRVMLITDADSRVSAIVSRSRELGVIYGISSRLCELRHLALDADIAIGDEVVTSGFSDIYPKGLLIGRVVRIIKEPRGLSLSATVKPAVDISKIEEVLCIE